MVKWHEMGELGHKITSATVLRVCIISHFPQKTKEGPTGYEKSKECWSCVWKIPGEHQFLRRIRVDGGAAEMDIENPVRTLG